MKVLVVGNGGREHAIAWKLLQSPQVEQVFCVPGNGGTAQLKGATNLPLLIQDFNGIARAATVNGISLIVVGPELPLSLGIADHLRQVGLKVFGPNQAGAQIESSKSWAKTLMQEAGIPTAASATFTESEPAQAYIHQQGAPIVIKADRLAAGKGVIVALTRDEAIAAVDELFQQGFEQLVIEDYLVGEEVSVLALTDGQALRTLLPAQDHKRIGEGDTGKNTGGMGAYAPAPVVTPALQQRIEAEILQPTLRALQQRRIDYCGVIYAGLMITSEGKPKVLEFNCRFGDPEIQSILPLLKTPLLDLLLACTEGRLAEFPPLQWHSGSCVCVVAAAGGYPDAYEKGQVITGLETMQTQGVSVFHAGTKFVDPQYLTNGGRVLSITAVGSDFPGAIAKAYQGIKAVQFDGMVYRRDIGHRVLGPNLERH